MAIIDITKNLHDDQTLGVVISDKPLKLLNQAALLSPAIAGTFEFKDDVLYFTKSTGLARVPVSLGGTSGSGTTNELAYWSSASVLGTLPVATYPSLTEISYVKGVTSAIQTQLNAKAATTALSDYLPLVGGSLSGNLNIYLAAPILNIRTNAAGTGGAPVNRKITWSDYLGNEAGYINVTDIGQQSGRTEMIFGVKDNSSVLFEAMRINYNGNVGIGTSPSYKLHVAGSVSGDVLSYISNSASNGYGMAIDGGSNGEYILQLRNYLAATKATFYANGNADFAGNLALGGGLSVANRVYAAASYNLHLDGSGTNAIYLNYFSGTSGVFFGNGASSVVGSVNSAGAASFNSTVTASNFLLSSDKRLKTNIKLVDKSDIDSIDIKQFNFKKDKKKRKRYGVLAQELEKVHPEMVYINEKGYKSVDYIDFLLVKIASLEKRLQKLE